MPAAAPEYRSLLLWASGSEERLDTSTKAAPMLVRSRAGEPGEPQTHLSGGEHRTALSRGLSLLRFRAVVVRVFCR